MKLSSSVRPAVRWGSRSASRLVCAAAASLLFAAAAMPLSAQTVTSAVPGLISYQGRVTNAAGTAVGAGTPVNRKVIFRIWSHPSNSQLSDLVYSEEQTVTISEGEFSVLIGQGTAVTGTPLNFSETAKGPSATTISSAAVFNNALRYLGVTIDDGTAAADPEVSPRQQLVSSAFAMRAKYAESLGANGNNVINALDNGNVGVGVANPTVRLDVAGTIRAGGASNPALVLTNQTSGAVGTVGAATNGGAYSADAAVNDLVMRADGGGKLLLQTGSGGSALAINSSNFVGIGQPNPGFPLNFASTLGDKISLYGNTGSHYGFGVQGSLLQIHTDNAAADVAFGYGSSGSFTETMRIRGNGNVGIGITAPTAKLHVNGSLSATSISTGSISLSGPLQAVGAVTTHTQGAFLEWNKDGSKGLTYLLNQRGSGIGGLVFGAVDTANTITEWMAINNSGVATFSNLSVMPNQLNGTANTGAATLDLPGTGTISVWDNFAVSGTVGIGTTSPVTTLDIRASAPAITVAKTDNTGGALYLGNTGHGLIRGYSAGNDVGLYTSAADIYLSANGAGVTNHFVLKNSGRVGIGVTNPLVPLHVRRHDSASAGTAGSHSRLANYQASYGVYLNNGALYYSDGGSATTGDNETISYNMISAIFEGEIVSKGGLWVGSALSYSDARAKTLLGTSDARTDLGLLRGLRIRDFTWIDRTVDGHRPNKKLLAQEVEAVFPQAVRRAPKPTAIPDIYQVAEKVDYSAARKELRLTVGKAHGLKVGDAVEIATDTEALREMKVTAVTGEREFAVACEAATKTAFVYGKYVDDFRAVDYEAIAMLNVSATQELARQVDALRASEARNAELSRRVVELEAEDRARDARMASIEKLLQATQTVMAAPAKAANRNGQE